MTNLRSRLKIGITTSLLALWVVPSFADVVLEERFDSHPDWHSGLLENDSPFISGSPDRGQHSFDGATLPDGWFSIRQTPQWSPSNGYPDGHESIEVLAANAEKSRGGIGKSFVKWRDSSTVTGGAWSSDGIAMFYLPESGSVPPDGLTELYVEFYITFSNEMIASYYADAVGSAKLFRVLHWAGDKDKVYSYFDESNKPDFIWGAGASSVDYGFRNGLAMLTKGDHLDPKKMAGIPYGYPFQRSQLSLSYTPKALEGMGVNGADALLPDKKNGGLITSGPAALDQVFGNETNWTKVAFYLKMNSAPGVYDGVLMQWIDDNRIFTNKTVAWIQPGYPMVKWNSVLIGGNDFFSARPNEERYQEWWAIDDLVIRHDIPAHLETNQISPPKPPLLDVE